MEETLDIIEKIKKLLALSGSSNEHEASAAAEMVSALALKYNIDLLELQAPTSNYKTEDVYNSTKTERWLSNIIAGLSLVNACKHYLVVQPDGSIKYRIVGKPHNIQVVNSLTEYLIEAIKHSGRNNIVQYNLNSQGRAQYRKAFRLAASQRLWQRFQEQFDNFNRKDNSLSPTTNALVVSNYYATEQKEIEEFLQNVKFKQTRAKSISLKSSTGYQDGIQAGSTINIGKQVYGVRNSRQIQ